MHPRCPQVVLTGQRELSSVAEARNVAHVLPESLRQAPFRGSEAVAAGLVNVNQLRGTACRRLFHDTYISADLPLDHRRWCQAAVLSVGPEAVVSGRSAAYLMGVDLLADDHGDDVELTVPHHSRVRTSGITVVHATLAPADVCQHEGIPVTSPERTAFDLARGLPRMDAVAAVDAVLHWHLTSLARVRDYLLASGTFRGRTQVAEVLRFVDPGAESPRESILRVTLVDGGLPRPETQISVYDANGHLIGRVDMGYREHKVGLEYEGDHHRDRRTFQGDLARVNALQEAGWTIIRATMSDLRDPRALLAQVRRALDRSRPTGGDDDRVSRTAEHRRWAA